VAVDPESLAGVAAEDGVVDARVDVVDDVQIDVAVAIDVGERAARAEGVAGDAGSGGDVREPAVTDTVLDNSSAFSAPIPPKPITA
jgi:hypothetical protein